MLNHVALRVRRRNAPRRSRSHITIGNGRTIPRLQADPPSLVITSGALIASTSAGAPDPQARTRGRTRRGTPWLAIRHGDDHQHDRVADPRISATRSRRLGFGDSTTTIGAPVTSRLRTGRPRVVWPLRLRSIADDHELRVADGEPRARGLFFSIIHRNIPRIRSAFASSGSVSTVNPSAGWASRFGGLRLLVLRSKRSEVAADPRLAFAECVSRWDLGDDALDHDPHLDELLPRQHEGTPQPSARRPRHASASAADRRSRSSAGRPRRRLALRSRSSRPSAEPRS